MRDVTDAFKRWMRDVTDAFKRYHKHNVLGKPATSLLKWISYILVLTYIENTAGPYRRYDTAIAALQ